MQQSRVPVCSLSLQIVGEVLKQLTEEKCESHVVGSSWGGWPCRM